VASGSCPSGLGIPALPAEGELEFPASDIDAVRDRLAEGLDSHSEQLRRAVDSLLECLGTLHEPGSGPDQATADGLQPTQTQEPVPPMDLAADGSPTDT